MDILDIFSYLEVTFDGLMNLLVFILLIVVIVSNFKKELAPDCKKGFLRFFMAVLFFFMFSTFFDFVYSFNFNILRPLANDGRIDSSIFMTLHIIVWIAKFWLHFPNMSITFTLFFCSMEIYLFNKKSNWKFMIFAIVLQIGSFLLFIINILMSLLFYDIGVIITGLIVDFLINFNYIIIGIVILILLRKTVKENDLLRIYVKPLSVGVIFLLIVHPIFKQFEDVRSFISFIIMYETGNYDFLITFQWIYCGIYFLLSISFIIGITFMAIGAMKTMNVPLTFAKEKIVKKIPQKTVIKCSECGVPIHPGMEFCVQCGHRF